jgi:hypothetical protein
VLRSLPSAWPSLRHCVPTSIVVWRKACSRLGGEQQTPHWRTSAVPLPRHVTGQANKHHQQHPSGGAFRPPRRHHGRLVPRRPRRAQVRRPARVSRAMPSPAVWPRPSARGRAAVPTKVRRPSPPAACNGHASAPCLSHSWMSVSLGSTTKQYHERMFGVYDTIAIPSIPTTGFLYSPPYGWPPFGEMRDVGVELEIRPHHRCLQDW